jgi:hypothetical protein
MIDYAHHCLVGSNYRACHPGNSVWISAESRCETNAILLAITMLPPENAVKKLPI